MTETRAARDEAPPSAANARCALCAPRNGEPVPAHSGQSDAVSHALLLVSAVADEQAVARLLSEALRSGMVLIDARPGAEPKIDDGAVPQRRYYRFGAAGGDVFSDRRLLALLVDHGVVHLFVAGSVAEACVKQTALSALARSFRVTFVDDAVPPQSSKAERLTKDFESRGAFTVTLEEFVSLAATTRKPDPPRAIGLVGRPDGSANPSPPRGVPAGVARKIVFREGPPGGRRIAWTAGVALAVAAAAAVWQGSAYVGFDGALKATADRVSVVLASDPPATAPVTVSEHPAPAAAASATSRDERQLAADTARDLAVLRIEFDTAIRESARTSDRARRYQLASESALADLAKELRQEQAKTASLASALATVRQELDRQDEDLAKSVLAPPTPALLPAIGRPNAADPPPDPSSSPNLAAPVRAKAVSFQDTGPSPPATPPPGPTAGEDIPRLMARASQLLSHGDIGAARIVLQRVSESGNVLALFALAETYDPLALTAMGAMGTVGDAAKARDLYTVALARGVEKAGDRLRALMQTFPAKGTP